MKVIIAGSRTITDRDRVFRHIESWALVKKITEVLCGMNGDWDEVTQTASRGVDMFGREWAVKHGIPVRPFPADWKQHGKSAGPKRNAAMADEADALIVVTTGSPEQTRGSFNMIENMEKRKKHIYWDMKR